MNESPTTIYIASDHGGYTLKKRIVRFLTRECKLTVVDCGPNSYDKDDDYPDYVIPLTKKVIKNNARGIVICKNGIGVSMCANKVSGIRCGIGYSIMAAETMMTDDNTNVLALAAKGLTEEHALAVVDKWLHTNFSNKEKHIRRLKKVAKLER